MTLNLLAGLILAINGQTHTCKGVTLDYLNITGSDITVVDCRIREPGPGTNGVSVYGNRNTLRRLLVERAGGTGVAFFSGDGHVLEDSVIRDPVRRVGWDSWGIYSDAATNLTVRNTTVYGSGYTQWNPLSVGTKLIGNRFVIPEEYRTDCKGNIQRDGPCQCGEFGIAIKGGDSGLAQGNTISGYRKADPVCGGTGTPGAGIATAAGGTTEVTSTRKWIIRNNTISDNTFGIYHGLDVSGLVIEANKFCRNTTAIQDGFSKGTTYRDNSFYNSGPVLIYAKPLPVVTGNRQLVECE